MPEISLTDFVDFVSTAGQPKLTVVRNVKYRDPYDPATDYWRRLREGIIEYHETNQQNRNWLDGLAAGVAASKLNNYAEQVANYKTFLGNRQIGWFQPPAQVWQFGELGVRVNPELGLIINGQRIVTKLYFKADQLAANRVSLIRLLLNEALNQNAQAGDEFAVLDIRRHRIHNNNLPNNGLLPLLQGEAVSFSTIWNMLPAQG